MDNLKRPLKHHFYDMKKSILGFWGTIIIVDIFFYFLNAKLFPNSSFGIAYRSNMNAQLSVVGGNIFAMLIFFIVYNYDKYYGNFPLSISFSVTRKNFYKTLVMDNIIIVFIFVVIQSILFKIEPLIIKSLAIEPYYEFALFNTGTDGLLFIVFSLFITSLPFIAIWNLIAALNYKFGAKLWIALFILGFITGLFGMPNLISQIFVGNLLNYRIDFLQLLRLGSITILCYLLGYFVIKAINVQHKAK